MVCMCLLTGGILAMPTTLLLLQPAFPNQPLISGPSKTQSTLRTTHLCSVVLYFPSGQDNMQRRTEQVLVHLHTFHPNQMIHPNHTKHWISNPATQ